MASQASSRTIRVARSISTSARPNTCSLYSRFRSSRRLPGVADAIGQRRARRCHRRPPPPGRLTRPMFPVTRSWGGAGSSEQPRLVQGGTPPGTTTTAGTRVDRRTAGTGADRWRRPRHGHRAVRRSCFTVARRLPAATPRITIGAPIRAASRAHWRQLAAGTDRLVNRRTSGVLPRPERPSAVRAAWRSAGSGAAVSPDDPGTVCPADCRAASPARFSARSMIERVQSPRPPSPALRSTSAARSRADTSGDTAVSSSGFSWANAERQHPARQSTAARTRAVRERGFGAISGISQKAAVALAPQQVAEALARYGESRAAISQSTEERPVGLQPVTGVVAGTGCVICQRYCDLRMIGIG